MHKLKSGYRHRQFDISRGSLVETYKGVWGEDSANGWYVDHKDSDTLDRRGPGFRTLREAVENIDDGVFAQCAECSEPASDCLCDGGEREPDLDALTEALQEEN